MPASLWILVVTCLLLTNPLSSRRRRRHSTCVTHPRLRDKWNFLDDDPRVYVRIRAHHVVYKQGSTKVVKYACVENKGNIYLLRKRKYKDSEDGVVCLGFSFIADHPRAEYLVLRLIEAGEGAHLLSPVMKSPESHLSIDMTCDLEGQPADDRHAHTTTAFIRRALPGCKFPPEIQGRWNFTYQHARMLEIWQSNATLHLMSGQDVRFFCDKRDGHVFVFRAKAFVSKDEDAIMCAEFSPMPEDPFYSFQVSRHNSGNLLDGQLRSVSRSKPVYVHVDCDWIGSPARPEFLYP
ncbi:unnamed protein product [Candidula unifasciata]|uniref:Uncharacterized protein n=1 Tax=Candidula unifasciata TaxID=100452 RepID=A0A8S3ZXP0_9EUPU|nr:unnamed protein product [Candidula unifasciata]